MEHIIMDDKEQQEAFTTYQKTEMQKEIVIHKLRQRGCRITKQRLILLDIILGEDCSSCKEIYYKASKLDHKIGSATVYRMVNTLEDIGAINRKNMYKIACGENCSITNACTIELENAEVIELSANEWNKVITAGLQARGYIQNQKLTSVNVKPCSCDKAC